MVFREDSAYNSKLKGMDRKEADRRLEVKLRKGMTRFEISEGLRAETLSLLPREGPWTNTVDQAQVESLFESFLVDEVPANPPNYELLKSVGADAVVEFVVERYGMRSSGGRAGTFIEGYGRMFFIDGGEIWRRSFSVDQLDAKAAHVDPFRVAKEPVRFRTELSTLIHAVAVQFAKDLNPAGRRASAEVSTESPAAADEAPRQRRGQPARPEAEGDLPDPDAN